MISAEITDDPMTTTSSPHKFASLHVIWQAIKTWYDDWFNLFILNFLVTISWVTIILGPPMLFALYDIGNELAHGRSNGVGELLRGVKRYFLVSWLWMIINIVVIIVVVVNISFYWQLGKSWSIILVSVFLFLGLFWAMMQVYVIPFYMEQTTKSIILAHKNAALTFLASPIYTAILFVFAAFLMLISYGFILPLILGIPSLVVVISNYAVIERIETFKAHVEETP
jgi:hypothetical protein